MPSSTPDWSALASENERVVIGCPASQEVVAMGAGPAGDPEPGGAAAHGKAPSAAATSAGHPGARRGPWRGRTARAAAAGTAAAAVLAGTAGPSAAATVPPLTWHLVRQVNQGTGSLFSAVTATGPAGGWAFSGNGTAAPQAFRRSGATWVQAPFPGLKGELVVAAASTGPADVWAFTSNFSHSRALRWNGSGWTAMRSFSRAIGGAAVISSTDVWVFGEQFIPGAGLGAWHYNGATWSQSPGTGSLNGGSALSATSVWAYGGTDVAHWNGHAWAFTSVASLLPARDPHGLNDPGVTAIYAQSADSVWAIGDGSREDEGGPVVVLHFNGRAWSKVATASSSGDNAPSQLAPDGRGGLWIPLPGGDGAPGRLLHYAAGHLTTAVLPLPNTRIAIGAVAWIPGTWQALAAGYSHTAGNNAGDDRSVLLQFER
jgi:hypothetical protein